MEQLNAQQEGLNLAYDEEGDYLNLNAEQMNEYIDAKMAVEESNALSNVRMNCIRKKPP